MKSNFAKSALIGILMGGAIALFSFLDSPDKIALSAIVCLVGGPLTVYLTGNYANLWAVVAMLFATPPMLLALGWETGLITALVFFFVYAIGAVQLSQVAFDIVHTVASLFRKSPNRE